MEKNYNNLEKEIFSMFYDPKSEKSMGNTAIYNIGRLSVELVKLTMSKRTSTSPGF
jgi:hypothetical protein